MRSRRTAVCRPKPPSLKPASFLVGIAAYLALPAFAWVLMIRSNLRNFASDVVKLDSGLTLLFWIFVTTTVLPPVVSIALRTDLPPIWNLQALFLVVVVSVAAVKFAIDRFDSVNLSAAVLMFLLGCCCGRARSTRSIATRIPTILRRNFLSVCGAGNDSPMASGDRRTIHGDQRR